MVCVSICGKIDQKALPTLAGTKIDRLPWVFSRCEATGPCWAVNIIMLGSIFAQGAGYLDFLLAFAMEARHLLAVRQLHHIWGIQDGKGLADHKITLL